MFYAIIFVENKTEEYRYSITEYYAGLICDDEKSIRIRKISDMTKDLFTIQLSDDEYSEHSSKTYSISQYLNSDG